MSWSLFNNEIWAAHQPHPLEMIEERDVNGNQGNNIEMTDINDRDVSSLSVGNKRRKKQSKVWEEMTKFTGPDGRDRARCNHCQKVFDGSSKKGTTHLNNHLQRCPLKRNNGAGGNADKRMDQVPNLTSSVVVEEKSVIDLIKSFFNENGNLTWDWDPFVLNSRKDEILKVYEEEKEELRRFFSQLSCRLNLAIWLCLEHYVLSVYYIDNSWEQKEKIISIFAANVDEERHHNYQNLVKVLKESCLDLKIDGKICSIIYFGVDETSHFLEADYEDVIGEINSWFNQRGNSLPFGGLLSSGKNFFYTHHKFSDKLGEYLWNKFGGIRKCIDYVKSMRLNRPNFAITVDNAKSIEKKVETSYFFLEECRDSIFGFGAAMGCKEAFLELERIDPDFKSRSINLTEKQWDEATFMYEHCQELLLSFHSWAESECTALNQYFPGFCDTYMKLLSLRQRIDEETSTLIEKLSSELEKCNWLLAIAVILDPRFKMDIVQLWYNKIYGCDADRYFEKIIHYFTNVYNKYYIKVFESENTTSSSSYLDAMGRPCKSSPKLSSELDRYLNDPKVVSIKDFDILAWWRAYTPIFPTLARMARDFLAFSSYSYTLRFDYLVVYHILKCKDLDDNIKLVLTPLTMWLESHKKINNVCRKL